MDLLTDNEKGDAGSNGAPKEATTTMVTAKNNGHTPGDEFQQGIDAERKKKSIMLDNLRRFRRRLAYKLAEKEAIAKLATMSKKSTKNIGYLRRKKESLEFRISTEAYTLEAEKDLIRKKNEVEAELQQAIDSFRLKRKAEFVASDIDDLTKKIESTNLELQELEKRLDVLYNGLRRQRAPPRQRKPQEQKSAEVSFADIAIIKDKKEDKKSSGA